MKKTMPSICVILVLLTVPAAFAQIEADFEVELTGDGKGAVIVKYTGTAAQVRFPAVIEGLPVKEIGGGRTVNRTGRVFGEDNVVGVVIPAGVTKIGVSAFESYSKLTSVTIPEGVTEIGADAFYQTGLTSITLPQSLRSIGYGAFDGSKLNSITIPEGVTEIGAIAFANCSALTAVTLPASIKTIGRSAFARCPSLTTVTYPDAIQISSLGTAAFSDCPKLNLASQTAIKKLNEISERNEKMSARYSSGG
jgi:hypothetical protein